MTARSPGGARRFPVRARAVVATVVVVAAIAALAVAMAGALGDDGRSQRETVARPPAAPRPEKAPPHRVRIALPRGWERTSDAPDVPGLRVQQPVGLRQPTLGLTAILGYAQPSSPSLLPRDLLPRVSFPLRRPRSVRLTHGIQAFYYRELYHATLGKQLAVYAAPTTDGIATLACIADRFTAALAHCEDAARAIDVAPALPLRPGMATAFRLRVPDAVAQLNGDRARLRARLEGAATLAAQAQALREASAAYRRAVDELAPLVPPVPRWRGRLVRLLMRLTAGYAALAGAVQDDDRARVAALRARVASDEAELGRLLAQKRASTDAPDDTAP